VTNREAPVQWDFDYLPDDLEYGDGWYGHDPVTEPIAVAEIEDHSTVEPVHDDAWDDYLEEAPREPAPPVRYRTGRSPELSALTFKAAAPPWYRTKKALFVVAAAAAMAVIVADILLIPGNDTPEPTSGTPSAPTTAPTPSTAPTLSAVQPRPAVPPPPPPPPPPQSAEPDSPPVYDGGRQWQPSPSQQKKPEFGVTRTPETRAPISVAPPQRQVPDSNSATPGDGRRGGWPW
jgi:hypothetical protein